MKLTDNFLVLYLTSLSIFRVDFLFGKGSFSLTPSLFLSLILLPVFFAFTLSGNLKVKKNVGYFVLFALAFLGWCIISIVPLQDFIQVKRLILFSVIILSTIAFIILFSRSNQIVSIFNWFCNYFIKIYLALSVIDVLLYTVPSAELFVRKFLPFYDTELSHIGYYIIRLKGGFIDANVGGFFMIFLYLILHYLGIGRTKRIIFTILIFCTFSKSAIGTIVILKLLIWLNKVIHRGIKINFSSIITRSRVQKILLGLVIVLGFIYILASTNLASRVSNAVGARLSEKDGSTAIHLALIEEGLRFIADNPVYLLKGYGFGSSVVLTQEFFPGDKYANFHSEYVTFLVEIGILGTILYLAFYIIPASLFLFYKTSYKNIFLLLALLAFAMENVLYQQYLFHYFWVFLGLIWVLPGLKIEDDYDKSI